MKKLDLYTKGKICGIYLIISSLISFLTFAPWFKVVRYTLDNVLYEYTPIEYFSLETANKAYVNVLIIFYVLLLISALSGVAIFLLSHFEKSSLIIPLINVFVSIAIVYLALGYFFECNGLNVPSIILYIIGVVVCGFYFVEALCKFIVKRMEAKAKKKIENMK